MKKKWKKIKSFIIIETDKILLLEPNTTNKYMTSLYANNNTFIIKKILYNLFTSNEKSNNFILK